MDSMRLARHSEAVRDKFQALIQHCKRNRRTGVSLNDEERRVLNSKKRHVVVLDPERPSHTLTTLPDDLLHYSEPRILSVREYARLQSFPDWFVFRGKYTTGGDKRRKECPRYTQVGNAVAPFVAEAMGFALDRILNRLAAPESRSAAAAHLANLESALQTRYIELIEATIDHGRIYFPSSDIAFFPADALADRAENGHRGQAVVFQAGGEEFKTDIRVSSGQRISPRSSFARYLKSVAAQPGEKLLVTRVSDREYRLEFLRGSDV
jgi:hypothetical protein